MANVRQMRSLRKLSLITFIITVVLLAVLIVTGFRQNSLMNDYSDIVKESESTIFFYSTIREQTTEGILSRNPIQLVAATREIEQLQSRYMAMLNNQLIPSQYKLSFLQNLDLEQLVLDLKYLAETPANKDLILKIIGKLRQVNHQFLQFDRIVLSEMRSRVMRDQKKGLVLMGLIVFLTSFSVIILYKKALIPLILITRQVKQSLVEHTPFLLNDEKKSSEEIEALIETFNQLQEDIHKIKPDSIASSSRETEFSAIINEVTNRLNGIINYSQLLTDYCASIGAGEEQKQMLSKIIENGEKSAAILQTAYKEEMYDGLNTET